LNFRAAWGIIMMVEEHAMNKIIVDSVVRTRLDNLSSAMELCDESGVTLGYFVPASDRERALYKWIQESVTDEELQHAFKEIGEYPLDEVLADLKDK
jgi:hypothetical protein